MFYLLLAILAILTIADHLTGTAWYQQKEHTMTIFNIDQFDIFADDDNGEERLYDLLPVAADLPGFRILTDEELADIDATTDDDTETFWETDPEGAAIFFGYIEDTRTDDADYSGISYREAF
jgi:hypothetical protein